jgi:hypothetical protein
MVERTANPETAPERSRSGTVSIVSASLAALASLISMVACCLPVLSFALAAGFAGLGSVLSAARPYLMAASVILIVFGFYQATRAKKCRRRPSVAASILLWLSALIVAVSIFFPQWMANIVANLTAR